MCQASVNHSFNRNPIQFNGNIEIHTWRLSNLFQFRASKRNVHTKNIVHFVSSLMSRTNKLPVKSCENSCTQTEKSQFFFLILFDIYLDLQPFLSMQHFTFLPRPRLKAAVFFWLLTIFR